ncbi:MAG: beta-ketoacyl-ACP synthase III [Lachnospiraceae bacterium]
MFGKIIGTGSYAPEQVVSNHDLSAMVETNDAWIQERTGVKNRHIVREETTVSMAVLAAQRALEDAALEAQAIDLIIVSTVSSNVLLPCTACEVQKAIGAVHATCFDLNAACTGFLFAYNTAQAYLAMGLYTNVLVIGAETLSDLIDWTDRGTCILFGDGAGAVVMQAAQESEFCAVSHSDGTLGNALTCDSRHVRDWLSFDEEQKRATYMQMDGREVFKFASRKVPESIEELLEKNLYEKAQIRYYILHQANKRIVESVAKRLGEPIEKFPMNLMEYGNTSSASIPILLDEMNQDGLLQPGDLIVLAGFGGGLSWGASSLKW